MARSPYTQQTWADGQTGGTPITKVTLDHIETGVKGVDVDLDAAEDAIAALQSTVGGEPGQLPKVDVTTRGTPTEGLMKWDTGLKLPIVGNGTAWSSIAITALTGSGSGSAPANFQAVVNPDNSVSTSWNAVAGTGVTYTLYEVFRSPNGVSGAIDITATSSLRPSSTSTVTREYFVRAKVGGVEGPDSNHVTVYLPYGSAPTTGGGQTGGGTGGNPASFLGIGTGWYANLGIGLDSGHIDIPYSDLINGYSRAGYFELNAAGTGVVMTSKMSGKTTSTNTKYARCESRELRADGTTKAAWTVGSGTHTWEWEVALNHIQPNKPWVTIGQVHDADSDAMAIKWKGDNRSSLDVVATFYDTDNPTKLLTGYNATLGDAATKVRFRVELASGTCRIYVNGTLKLTSTAMSGKGAGGYWKLGVYPQSKDNAGGMESPSEYCQATFYSHVSTHSPAL